MTHEERAQRFVDSLMHKTHLRFQRQELAQADTRLPDAKGTRLPLPVIKGERRVPSVGERRSQEFQQHWFTGLRPNFWRAYFETLQEMQR